MQDYEESPVEVSTPKIHGAFDDSNNNSQNNKKNHNRKNQNLAPVNKNNNNNSAPVTAPIPLLTPEQVEEAKASIPSQDMNDPVAQSEKKEHGRINLMPIKNEPQESSKHIPDELAAAQAEAAAEAQIEYAKQVGMQMPQPAQPIEQNAQNQTEDSAMNNGQQFNEPMAQNTAFDQIRSEEPEDMFSKQPMPTPSNLEQAPVADQDEQPAPAPEPTQTPAPAAAPAPAPAPAPSNEAAFDDSESDGDDDDFENLIEQRIEKIREKRRKALEQIEQIESNMVDAQIQSVNSDTPVDFREEIAEITRLSQQITTYSKNVRRYIRVL